MSTALGGDGGQMERYVENCRDIDAVRRELEPYADLVVQCFHQGLTVDNCAWFLHTLKGVPSRADHELLDSEVCRKAIRELFWARTSGASTEALIFRTLGFAGSDREERRHLLAFIKEYHPALLSWVPSAYQNQMAKELDFDIAA